MKWDTGRKAKRHQIKLKHAMLRWKVQNLPPQPNSQPPLTPDPSPQTSPVISHWDSDDDTMTGDDFIPSRPKSMVTPREGRQSPPQQLSSTPLLADVLSNTAPPPYTLSAFTAFLSQNHCLETLEFTMAARKYQEKYNQVSRMLNGKPMSFDSQEVRDLQYDWRKIMSVYLSPGSLREINLPSDERDDLLHFPFAVRPPPPDVLEPAIQRMHDLMQESIFLPFINHHSTQVSPTQTYNTPAPITYGDEAVFDESSVTFDDRPMQNASRLKHTSSASADFNMVRSPPTLHRPLSALTTALHKPLSSSSKVSQQISHTSAGSSSRDGGFTDDSGSLSSPGLSDMDMMTPPTTPPSSDLGSQQHSPKTRSDSGAWKRMGAKLGWPRKRSQGTLRDRLPSTDDTFR